jgi:hypothetical protein
MEQGSPSITLEIEGRARQLVIDTGSTVSILQPSVSSRVMMETPLKPFGVTGDALKIIGQQRVSFVLKGREFEHTFVVCPLPTRVAGILGMDFLESAKAEINLGCRVMALPATTEAPRVCGVSREERAALTVFMEGKAEPSLPPERREQLLVDKPALANSCCDQTWLVKATENVVIPPRSHQIISGKLDLEKGHTPPQTVCVEPAPIPIYGILPARVLSRVGAGKVQLPQPSPVDIKVTQRSSRKTCPANFNNAKAVRILSSQSRSARRQNIERPREFADTRTSRSRGLRV